MQFKDYYQVLEIEKNAPQEEIKRSYRKLARKFHPDINKDPAAEARFKEIGEAYEVLKDSEKRAAYDNLGSQWQNGQEFKPPPNWDAGFEFSGKSPKAGGYREYSDFFEELFTGFKGHQDHRSQARRFSSDGDDHHAKLAIDLEDSFHGLNKTISLKTTGIDPETGELIIRPHTLNVKIPKGIREGQRIRLPGQGGPGFGEGKKGDLYIEIVFNPHPLFNINGRDIILNLPVAPWEAALGSTVNTPVLGGTVELKIPADSQTDRKLRLKGKGIPGNPPGDHYAILKVVIPKADTEKAKEFYRNMEKEMPMNARASMNK